MEPLTSRELEVVRLIVDGLTNAEIAGALGITERTVQAHVAAARRKLEARSRTQLAVFALRLRLVPLDG
jgi:DNA-binding NarL/FixJ family response regulator